MSFSAPRFLAGLILSLAAFVAQAAQQDLIFVFDNSGSMRKADPAFAAREEARKFLAGLKGDVNAGVIVFDQNVTLAAPLAPVGDGSALAGSLDSVDYKGKFTDSPAAIERAIYELKTHGRPDAMKSVVFMTDGIVDTGNRGQDAERTRWLREDLAADAVLNGIRIHGIAFTGAADLLLIQSLATKTSAEYFRAETPAELPAALAKVQEILAREPPPEVAAPTPEPAPAPAPAATEAPPVVETAPTPAPAEQAPPAAEAPAAPVPVPPTPADGGPALSEEELKSLEQLSKETGVPVEQLIAELQSAQPGEAVVMRPEPAAEEAAAPALSTGKLAAIGGAILAVLIALWLLFRNKGEAPKKEAPPAAPVTPAAGAPKTAVLDAWLVDINGLTGEPPRKLGEKPLMIGRIAGSDPDYLDYYVVNRATVGRRHAVIRFKDRGYWLVDQGSVNGTFVNDEKVLGERQLRHGDRIKLHKFEFEFQCPDGVNQTVVGLPADQTIVASMDQTLAAASTAALAAAPATGTMTRAAAGVAGVAAAAPLVDDLFDGDFGDAQDDSDITAVDGDLAALEADKAAFFTDSGKHTAMNAERTEVLHAPAATPDEFGFDEEPETLAVEDLLRHTNFGAQEDAFAADASAFFDDVTVHPSPDLDPRDLADDSLDVLDITVARDPSFSGMDVPDGEDFATATTVMPSLPPSLDAISRPLATGTFGQMDTVLGAGPVIDDGDETLEDFLDTSTIDRLPPPPDSPLPASGAFDDFLETPEETTNDLAELAAQEAGDEIFDVTGEIDAGTSFADAERTTVLPASPVDTPPPTDTVVLPTSPLANKPKP